MSETKIEQFRVGDRVRLSAHGLERSKSRSGGYQGVVVRIIRGSTSVRVVFDGNKSPTTLHASYLVLDRDW